MCDCSTGNILNRRYYVCNGSHSGFKYRSDYLDTIDDWNEKIYNVGN